jgi:hypothetical protein
MDMDKYSDSHFWNTSTKIINLLNLADANGNVTIQIKNLMGILNPPIIYNGKKYNRNRGGGSIYNILQFYTTNDDNTATWASYGMKTYEFFDYCEVDKDNTDKVTGTKEGKWPENDKDNNILQYGVNYNDITDNDDGIQLRQKNIYTEKMVYYENLKLTFNINRDENTFFPDWWWNDHPDHTKVVAISILSFSPLTSTYN